MIGVNPLEGLDLTNILIAIIGGVFTVLGIVLPVLINARVKDKQAADVLGTAVKNSLGAIEQGANAAVTTLKPRVALPASISPQMGIGVQYVLDHAGPEAARFGITPEAIADKINAQIGVQKIATGFSNITTAITIPAPAAAKAAA